MESLPDYITSQFSKSANKLGQSGGNGYNNHVANMYAMIAGKAGEAMKGNGDKTQLLLAIVEEVGKMRDSRVGQFGDPFGLLGNQIKQQHANIAEQIKQDGGKSSPLSILKYIVAQTMGGGIPSWLNNVKEDGYLKENS
jgi:hypothetical protein